MRKVRGYWGKGSPKSKVQREVSAWCGVRRETRDAERRTQEETPDWATE